MGPYWAIGCLSRFYLVIAIVGLLASLAGIPATAGASLIGVPIVFAFIVTAQLLMLLIDIAHSVRGTHTILSQRADRRSVPPSPGGMWEDEQPARRPEDAFRRR